MCCTCQFIRGVTSKGLWREGELKITVKLLFGFKVKQ